MSNNPSSAIPTPSDQPRPPKAMDFAAAADWEGYFRAVAGKPARETLVKALDLFATEGVPGKAGEPPLAVDLACGEGRDTFELLRRGWRVIAIDGHPAGIRMVLDRTPPEHTPRLIATEVADFTDARWPECDLLNCSFSLPFCPPAEFPGLWQRIRDSIRPGGRFSGQLFGDRDTWARCHKTTGLTRPEVEAMLDGFSVEMLDEEERDDVTTLGEPKHWHVYHIVARRPNSPGA